MSAPHVFENGYAAITTSTGGAAYTQAGGVKEVTSPISRAELADSVMGDTLETIYPGVLNAPVTLRIRQDFTTGTSVDAKFWSLLWGKVAVKLKIRPTSTGASSTNPSLIWSKVFVTAITPISGAWGAALENRIELRAGSGCTLSRSSDT